MLPDTDQPSDIIKNDPPKLSSHHREDGSFYSFEAVEERLIEAMQMVWRLPDRENAWLGTAMMSLWRQVKREWGDYVDSSERPRRPGLTRHEVGEMDEALGWLDAIDPADRKLIGLAISCLARGDRQVPWMRLRKRMGVKLGAAGLRMRYSRAITAIANRLNAGFPPAGPVNPKNL